MNWLFGALHLQGIEFEPVWPVPDGPGRERRSLGSQLLPLLEPQVGARISGPAARNPRMTLTPLKPVSLRQRKEAGKKGT